MKKINLFNKTISPLSDGKGCPVEQGGVWELPRRTPCATPSWKEGEHKVPSFRGTGPRKNVPSFRGNAESPRCCRELVCSKTNGIPLFSGMTKKICHKFPSREGWRVAPAGVWFAALVALFIATPSFAEPTELDKKTVASKAYVDTKQDIIETDLVTFHEPEEQIDYDVPALVSYGTGTNNADGVLGNKIGVLGINQNLGGLHSYDFLDLSDDEESGYLDNFVPTVRSVSYEMQSIRLDKQDVLSSRLTGSQAPKGNQAVVLGNSSGSPSSVYTTAGKNLALTEKFGAEAVMNYIDGTTASATFASGQGLTEAQVKATLVSLELLKDVYSALHTEIQNAAPTGTPGNVAMYDATTGALGDGVATYDGSTTYNASTDADKIAVMSGVQRKKECGGYEPAPAGQPAHDGTHPGDEDYCWLWIFPD